MGEFRMPVLGADMESGTVAEWRVTPGDAVHRGDVVAVISTDKSDIDAEVFEDGVIESLVVPEGVDVPVGTVLATLRSADGSPPAPVPPSGRPGTDEPPPGAAVPSGTQGHDPLISPLVRHLAERTQVDVAAIHGSGVGHRITRHDVEAAADHTTSSTMATGATTATGATGAGTLTPDTRTTGRPTSPWGRRASPLARRLAADRGMDLPAREGTGPGGAILAADLDRPPPTPPPAAPGERLDRARHAVGELMARSKQQIPHYYVQTTVDLHAARRWLDAHNSDRPVRDRVLPAALLLCATARAAARSPRMNGHWSQDFEPADHVHLGVAVARRGGGLVAPAIPDADTLTVDALMTRLLALVTGARSGHLPSWATVAPTLTVTDLGERGADSVFGVIYPPQVALVGFGGITDRPVAIDGAIAIHPCTAATLSADHRASDGRDGSRFLAEVEALLQEPDALAGR